MKSPNLRVHEGCGGLTGKLNVQKGDFVMFETHEDSIECDTALVGGYVTKITDKRVYLSTQHPSNDVLFAGIFGMRFLRPSKGYDLSQLQSYKVLSNEKPKPALHPATGKPLYETA